MRLTGASRCSGSSSHGGSGCGNDSLDWRRHRMCDRQDARLTGASRCSGSSSRGSSGSGSGSSRAAILPEAVEKVADLEMIDYASFVRVFEKLR